MNIVKESFEILTPISKGGVEELKLIERAARTCYKSEKSITEDGSSAAHLVKNLIASGHEAMLEHSILSVKFIVDRGVTHEMVRHRLASFAQESTRYCNYSNEKFGEEITVISPFNSYIVSLDTKLKNMSAEQLADMFTEWSDAINDAETHYMHLLQLGASPQIARSVLPNSTKAEIVITANYREWRNIFKLRTDAAAHPQIRYIMTKLLIYLQSPDGIPIIFDDI